MAKNRNKGFSLIEVIIAVAVLTILLTPVISQLVSTLKTDRLAKEQQYANESATNVLEYAQTKSFNELKEVGTSGDIYVTSYSSKTDRNCDIYILDTTTNSIKPIDDYSKIGNQKISNYVVNTFKLNDVELGSRRTTYSRTLMLDDLSNRIASYEFVDKSDNTQGLKIYYDVNRTVNIPEGLASNGFAYTTEGSIVKYTTDDDGTYISGIVCELNNASKVINDPNQSTLGTMLNLNGSQVALVNGDSTNFDKQAMDDLYAAALAYLKTNNPTKYDQCINGTTNPLNEPGYLDSLYKSTTVKIDEGSDTFGPYFLVKVDVAYKCNALPDAIEANVFSQKFYYEDKKDEDGHSTGWKPTAPAVYIEYQPFSVNGEDYSSDEYIYVENYVDSAKIYLYKPLKDMGYMSTTTGATVANKKNEVVEKNTDGEGYSVLIGATPSGVTNTRVKVHINTLTKTNEKSVSTTGKKTYIYTNIVDKAVVDGKKTSSINTSQFDTSLISTSKSIYGTSEYAAFGAVFTTEPTQAQIDDAAGKTTLYLRDVYDDTTLTERLYTATVIVEPLTENVGNTVTLTGAKGGK